jgi:rhodanese-related sulfurtransferase
MSQTPEFSNTYPLSVLSVPSVGEPCAPGEALTVPAVALFKHLEQGAPCRILDVRTGPEFEAAHLRSSVNHPLDVLNPEEWRDAAAKQSGPLFVMCQAGGRAGRAGQVLAKAGVSCHVVEGGLDAWIAAGFPVERGASRVLPLMRQVQIVIGLVSGTGSALALFKNPLFAIIPLFMGAGLVFAGMSGTCGLALLMARMPWNRSARAREGGAMTDGVTAKQSASCCTPATPGGSR